MQDREQDSPSSEGKLSAWIWARWRWLLAGVVLLFILNNLAGIVVGAVGLVAFANRIVGGVLGGLRAVQQVQEIVGGPEEGRSREEREL